MAKILAEKENLENNSTVFQELLRINDRESTNERSIERINAEIGRLEAQKQANMSIMKQEIKEIGARKDAEIQKKYMDNLTANAKDIHAYYVNNLSEIRAKFNEIPDSAQRIIFKTAGFVHADEPSFNLKEALNDIGNIILNEQYGESEVKTLMGFFKGLKKVENRGPFDYRLSRAQDATGAKKDGDKK